ncbi:MAG: hypothetical protein U1E45_02080 [Geminicoccaceae bacterium]
MAQGDPVAVRHARIVAGDRVVEADATGRYQLQHPRDDEGFGDAADGEAVAEADLSTRVDIGQTERADPAAGARPDPGDGAGHVALAQGALDHAAERLALQRGRRSVLGAGR